MSFENSIQDLINSFDHGTGARITRGFILLFIAVVIFAIYIHSQSPGLKNRNAMEQAQIARNLATGNGFTTQCIRPTDMQYFNKDSGICPVTRHAPLYPLLLSTVLKTIKPPTKMETSFLHSRLSVFAADQQAVIPLTIIISIATGLIIFLMGCRLFNTRTGLVASILYLLTEAVLYDGISGTSIPLVSFFTASASYAAIIASRNKAEGHAIYTWFIPFVTAAVLCGLACLTKYAAIALLPALVVYIGVGFNRGRLPAIIAFVIIFCITVSPWMIRNHKICGNPLGISPYSQVMHNSPQYPDDSFDRTLDVHVNNHQFASAVKSKLRSGLSKLADLDIRLLGGGLIMCFFLVSLFNRSDQQETTLCKWGTTLGILLLLPILAVTDANESRLLHMFLPMITLCGTVFFFESMARSDFLEDEWQTVLTWSLILSTALLTALASSSNRKTTAYPPCFPPFISYIDNLVEPGKTICTDIPWATAWYGNRRSILLPVTRADFLTINEKHISLHGLYITTETSDRPYTTDLRDGYNQEWLPVLNGKVPPDFPLQHGISLPGNKHDQIFLTPSTPVTPTP
ncbi:MAG: glycosyltransferase family 39 protein [Kiritimatiellae bacterium]|nr:glycosyltransferase family 39 protein [Kiritimatiellia bacterium]